MPPFHKGRWHDAVVTEGSKVVAILLTKSGTTTLEPTGSADADPPPFAKGRCYNNFRTHTDVNDPTVRFTQREMHDVTVTDAKLYTSLSQREVARRSRDGGFNGSCDTPLTREVYKAAFEPTGSADADPPPFAKGGCCTTFCEERRWDKSKLALDHNTPARGEGRV